MVADRREVGEVGDGVAAQRPAAGPLARVPVAAAAGRSMPIRTSSRGLGDLLGGMAEQDQWRPPETSQPR